MIKNYNLLFLLFLAMIQLQGCTKVSSNPIKMGVISDSHYLSEQLMGDGNALQNYINMSGKDIRDVPLVLEQVLDDYQNSDIEVLLIPGDITKDGEKQSHIDFRKKLQPLIDKGVKIFVIPGNHDINIPHSVRYEGDNTYPVENVSPQEFAEIYTDCGYGNALRRDTASLSYVAELNDNTWLLAIDAAKYKEYTANKTLSSGRIQPETERWILDVFDEAKRHNKEVIGMMHYGLVEHFPMQAYFFKDYIVDDWQRMAPLLADLGMKAIFTGHFHANDITEYKSPIGNKIYDIETGSLVAYAYPYRFVEISDKGFKVKTKNVESIPGKENLAKDNRVIMKNRARLLTLDIIREKGIHLAPETLSTISELTSEIFVKHLAGDEKIDDQMRETIAQLIHDMDVPKHLAPEHIEMDFYPPDNNIEITY